MNRKTATGADFLAQAVDFHVVHVREFTEAGPYPEPEDFPVTHEARFALQVALVPQELLADLLDCTSTLHRNYFAFHYTLSS